MLAGEYLHVMLVLYMQQGSSYFLYRNHTLGRVTNLVLTVSSDVSTARKKGSL